MILYYSPGACSMADHIALNEAGLAHDLVKVDLRAKQTAGGDDFWQINPKGYVPALALDSGELLTENVAIMTWIASQAPGVAAKGELAQIRTIETLTYISTELHKQFGVLFQGGTDEAKATARERITKRLSLLAPRVQDGYLFGPEFTVADAYLFTVLSWCKKVGVDLADPFPAYYDRMAARDAVKRSLQEEGLA
ncbi:glutathione S-transferase N-terminal domain-containing protein [Phenylobacterium immobile]|uniref:glutathione S-transferase N-terminal domain-containing protein n=1 Tax=Phenylobacterium immobile TaxID=21 RepID=UPI000A6D0F38|nr:glutathione S-transferase N-terminal domain-containing protein [Phenylobacterium immobile]